MPRKPKTPQKEDLIGTSLRDNFQTPNYAVDLLVPFIPRVDWIWECASGLGKIANRLMDHEYKVYKSDLQKFNVTHCMNFLTDDKPVIMYTFGSNGCIITNPPFSLKRKFFLQCIKYKFPFALLIPADYSGWTIEAVDKFGCEKIIPTRRIDYITPDVLKRIHEGEIWEGIKRTYVDYKLEKFKKEKQDVWNRILEMNKHFCNYESIYDAPKNLLRKYSSCQFHSMWLTWGFNIGRRETFVELTNEQKNNI